MLSPLKGRTFASMGIVRGTATVADDAAVAVARAANSAVNPRLIQRLDAFRAYQARGGAKDMLAWVKSTQSNSAYGTGVRSGYVKWINSVESVHGNSTLSSRTAVLYRLEDPSGTLLKWGITQDMSKRYSNEFLLDKQMFRVAQGSRADMLRLERQLIETQMISIGVDYMGPELRDSQAYKVLNAALNLTVTERGDFKLGDEPSVNVVFLVPGSLGSLDFDFPLEGKFSAKDKLLRVDIPVPQEIVNSESISEFIIDSLHSANAVAFDFFRRRGRESFALEKAEAIVKRIQNSLAASA
ncbi:MAG: hypothetical protein K8U03_11180 [Planctomycetia bacterium]|nr:hypothetical protein [Planctomycetia bacterium]